MSNIDKQALQAVADLKAGYTLVHADVAILNKLARIALASLEAEPVGYFGRFDADDEDLIDQCSRNIRGAFPLYAAPPAPVSVPDEHYQNLSELYHAQEKRLFKLVQRIKGPSFDKYAYSPSQAIDVLESAIFGEREEDCRAAMLQGAEPVTTAYKLPANTPCKDAPEHIWLQTAGVWPENGEFSELTWCSDNQHPDDTLYVRADVVPGNSPVIPDGWKLVPIELTGDMTNAMSEAILDDLHNVDVWRSVLAAAPQQEAK